MSRINNTKLTVYHNTTDISDAVSVFKGTKPVVLGAASFVYIGSKKPIHTIYLDIMTANTSSSILVVEKYNGTEYEIIDRQDETFGASKSGHIFTDELSTEVKTTYQGKEMYWIRVSTMTTTSSIALRYVGLVLCALEDLVSEEVDIELFYPVDPDTNLDIRSFLGSMQASTDDIIHRLNQAGKYKYNGVDISLLTVWDIFNINELRPATKFLTLHKIFRNRYDNKDDTNKDKSVEYYARFDEAFNEFKGLLTLDTNGNGVIDETEKEDSKSSSYRLNR